MKRTFSILCLLTVALSANADLIVYKTKDSIKTYGNGLTASSKRTGYTIIDPGTGDISEISSWTVNGVGYYHVSSINSLSNYFLGQVLAGKKNYTVFARANTTDDSGNQRIENVVSKGFNAPTVVNGHTWMIPKVWKRVQSIVRTSSGNQNVLEETTSTIGFDKSNTSYFELGFTMEAAIDYLKSFYIGYTER